MSDWLARKLAERQAQPPQMPQVPVRPAYPTAPPGYGQQTVAPGYAQPQVGAPQVPVYGAPGQPPTSLPSPQDIPTHVDPNQPFDTAIRAAAAKGDQHRTSVCPECHQDALIQITTNESGYPLRIPPAPHCTNCGFPRTQSGSIHGGANLMKPQGRAKAARQLSNHAVTVDWDGVPATYEPQAGGASYV